MGTFVIVMKVMMFALQIIPAVLEAIKAVNAAIPIQGAGAAKLSMIENTVSAVYQVDAQTETEIPQTKMLSVIRLMATAFVKTLNSLEVFTTSNGSQAAAVTETPAAVVKSVLIPRSEAPTPHTLG